ncbi:MAG: hypothetical protein Q8P82_02280 [bacterium]|nr:hypothetical protein [bacterium]
MLQTHDEARPHSVRIITRYGEFEALVRNIPPARRLLVMSEQVSIPRTGRLLEGEVRSPAGLVELNCGEILFPQIRHGQSRHDHFPEGIFSAIRGRARTMLGYGAREGSDGGEADEISVLGGSTAELWCLIAAYGQQSTDERAQITQALTNLSHRLDRVRDSHKLVARRQIKAGAPMVDRRQRPNPGAARARLVAGMDQLTMRLRNIQHITPKIGFLELVLIGERDRIYRIFAEVETTLANLVGERGRMRDMAWLAKNQRGVAERLRRLGEAVRTIRVQPFMCARNALIDAFTRISDDLGGEHYATAIRRLEDSARVVASMQVLRRLEAIRLELSCAEEAGQYPMPLVAEIRAFAKAADDIMSFPHFASRAGLSFEWKLCLQGAAAQLEKRKLGEAKDQLEAAAGRIYSGVWLRE